MDTIFELYSQNPIAQSLGFCAMIFFVISFSLKKDVPMKVFLGSGQAVSAIHFFLLGVPIAWWMEVLLSIRSYLSVFSQHRTLAFVFVAFFIALGFWQYQWVLSLFPIFGSTVATVCLFYLSWLSLRFGMLVSMFFWLIHDIWAGTIWWVIATCIGLVSLGITILRMLMSKWWS